MRQHVMPMLRPAWRVPEKPDGIDATRIDHIAGVPMETRRSSRDRRCEGKRRARHCRCERPVSSIRTKSPCGEGHAHPPGRIAANSSANRSSAEADRGKRTGRRPSRPEAARSGIGAGTAASPFGRAFCMNPFESAHLDAPNLRSIWQGIYCLQNLHSVSFEPGTAHTSSWPRVEFHSWHVDCCLTWFRQSPRDDRDKETRDFVAMGCPCTVPGYIVRRTRHGAVRLHGFLGRDHRIRRFRYLGSRRDSRRNQRPFRQPRCIRVGESVARPGPFPH